MALPVHTTATLSCEASQESSGPVIVHSTGVQGYRIQPELIQMLQKACTNNKLTDHEKGVLCKDSAARILDVFKSGGFTVTAQAKAGSRKIWLLTKTGEGGSDERAGGQNDEPSEEEKPEGDGEEEKEEEEPEEE